MNERIERELKCPKCLHEWESRVYEPKECPHCKKRLDWKVCDYVLPQEGEDEADMPSFRDEVYLEGTYPEDLG